MVKKRCSEKGQIISGEYVVASVLMIAALVSMSVYFRRALQARVHDTQLYAINEASTALYGSGGNKIPPQYEPYYTKSYAQIDSYQRDNSFFFNGGMVNKTINTEQGMTVFSKQLEPGLAQ